MRDDTETLWWRIARVEDLPPEERMREAAAIIEAAKAVMGRIRQDTVFRLTRHASWETVAADLGTSKTNVSRLLADRKIRIKKKEEGCDDLD